MQSNKFFTYENKLLIVLFFTFGLIFMDKMSFTFLLPFIQKDLGFSNTQSGLVLGILSAFFGISTLVFSIYSDIIGSKKKMLVIFVILFSLATLSVGLISDFNSMLIVRALMGITEGPAVPLILSTVLAASTVSRRGFNMGLIKGAGPLMSGVFAPMILIPIALSSNWKWGFYTLAIPGFIMATVIWFFMKEPVFESEEKPNWNELKGVIKNRNVQLCLLISIFFMTNLISFIGFAPLYWANMKQVPQSEISVFLAVFGIGCFVWFFVIPMLSDKFGRKPTLTFFALASMALPLVMANFNLSFGMTILVLLTLTCAMGYMPLFDAVIPAESVPHKYAATVMALTVLTGEVIGGTLGPIISGMMADKYDLHAPFYVGATAAFIAFLLSLGIKETAPKVRI
ncbi:MAG: MFS transporter [Saprospiraceae bacterium]|nr:MFS transporter [Saprospiraceae bacterium]